MVVGFIHRAATRAEGPASFFANGPPLYSRQRIFLTSHSARVLLGWVLSYAIIYVAALRYSSAVSLRQAPRAAPTATGINGGLNTSRLYV